MPRSSGAARVISLPSRRIIPSSGSNNPMRMRNVVVFPHPEGPRMDKNSPSRTSKVRLCSVSFPSKRLTRPRTESLDESSQIESVISTSISPAISSSHRDRLCPSYPHSVYRVDNGLSQPYSPQAPDRERRARCRCARPRWTTTRTRL